MSTCNVVGSSEPGLGAIVDSSPKSLLGILAWDVCHNCHLGFLEVVSGPMVRSSYRAEQVLQKNNVGLAV